MEDLNAKIVNKIHELKSRRNAVILAHNYELGEVQDIADFVGDSLELSQKASKINADVIVFCGVHFMAETASILSPDKKVIFPDLNAGCPMADMISAPQLIAKKKEYPDAAVVCYVNSTAAVKAESDICCTSANAVKVVQSLDSERIIFVPDQYLGDYVASKTPNKKFIFWPGYCPTHARIRPEDILKLKSKYRQAKVMIHPECRPEARALADEVLSTGGMLKFAQATSSQEIIVGTELGIIYRLKKDNPLKNFIPVSEQAICPRMKLITLEKILQSLEEMKPEIKVPEEIRIRAKIAVDRMLAVGS